MCRSLFIRTKKALERLKQAALWLGAHPPNPPAPWIWNFKEVLVNICGAGGIFMTGEGL